MRLLSKHCYTYTEMINEHAILYAKKGQASLLGFHKESPQQNPVVCQIGGNSPEKMALAAKVVEEYGYDEVNVNCGCPSNKTVVGCFGAVLMYEPETVARITREMQKAVSIPVTVKCRLGVDDMDSYPDVHRFIQTVSHQGGVEKFIIHARKCFLNGLNPKENRTIPPLKYDWVLKLKKDFPDLRFVINGGFNTVSKAKDIMREENQLEGCMVGRLAYDNPWELAKVDREIFGETSDSQNREDLIRAYAEYAQKEQDEAPDLNEYIPNTLLIKPLIHLFNSEYEGGAYRKFLTEAAINKQYKGKIEEVLLDSMEYYRNINPEALVTKNGIKVLRPGILS